MKPQRLHLAILALGGQGGGVLVDWIVALAERAGWTAQATSVAGVAQRTGATIYYLELVEPTPGREPVLALMPVPGEVDVLIAAELMEAGRAVERGLVTPTRTTLIASSHRTYAVQEKLAPGNGIADSAAVLAHVQRQARRSVIADMQTLAQQQGSVISASLFGALAGSGALPFALQDYEAVVQASGVGVQPSLAALRAAATLAREMGASAAPVQPPAHETVETAPRPLPAQAAAPALQPLLQRVRAEFPAPAWNWLGEGLARVVDWQDLDYGHDYLDRVAALARRDDGAQGHALSVEAARWIAVAMSYDDVIRVAELKSRGERSARLRREIGARADEPLGSEEFFHPRLEEALATLPRRLADWLDGSPRLRAWLAPRLDRGRRIRSQGLAGHLQLRLVAGLRRWRRGSRRHAQEGALLRRWLDEVDQALDAGDGALAIELLRCRRLVKGYSDTHERGNGRFMLLLRAAAQLRGRDGGAAALARLRDAALCDAEGQALSAELAAQGLG